MKTLHSLSFLAISMNLFAGPLDSWEEMPLPPNAGYLYSVTYANGMFVAVGSLGGILTSPDGMTWAKQVSGISADLARLKYLNGRFFAFINNQNSTVLTSTDGVAWDSQLQVPDLRDLTFFHGRYWAVSGGSLVRSTDLTQWETIGAAPSLRIDATETFMFSFGDPTSFVSNDGFSWQASGFVGARPTGPPSIQNGILYFSEEFMETRYYPPPLNAPYVAIVGKILSSSNGGDWSFSELPSGHAISGPAIGGTNFVALGRASIYYAGGDLTHGWTQIPLPDGAASGGSASITFGNSHFVAIIDGKIYRSNPVGGAFPPEIVKQPSSLHVRLGEKATFAVRVQGTEPYTYQWRKNGMKIDGATDATFSIPSVTFNSPADYDVVVTNPGGTATSLSATLGVDFTDIRTYNGVTVNGNVGDKFLIEYQDSLDPSSQWHTAATLTLTAPSFVWIDYDSPKITRRFYKATYLGN